MNNTNNNNNNNTNNNKKYVESKEKERYLPGYYPQISLECAYDDEKRKNWSFQPALWLSTADESHSAG